jgi:hypothetical protein
MRTDYNIHIDNKRIFEQQLPYHSAHYNISEEIKISSAEERGKHKSNYVDSQEVNSTSVSLSEKSYDEDDF